MSIKVQTLPQSKVKITAKPTKEDVETASTEALRKLSDEIDIPGFRRGKAPLKMVRQRVNETKLVLETMDILATQLFRKVINEHSLWPLRAPRVSVPGQEKFQAPTSLAQLSESLTLAYEVEVKPQVKLKNYTHLPVKRQEVVVAEKEVAQNVSNIFREWKGRQEAEKSQNEIVTAKSLSEAEKKATEEQRQTQERLAKVEKTVPDDEWAQLVGSPSLIALKTKVRDFLREIRQSEVEKAFEESVFDTLIAQAELFDLPESLVSIELERQEKQARAQMETAGVSLEKLLEREEKSLDEVKSKWRQSIERQLRIDLILDFIAQQEEINISDQELDKEVQKVQDEKLRKRLENDEQKEYIRHRLRQRKTLEWLKERVVSSAG